MNHNGNLEVARATDARFGEAAEVVASRRGAFHEGLRLVRQAAQAMNPAPVPRNENYAGFAFQDPTGPMQSPDLTAAQQAVDTFAQYSQDIEAQRIVPGDATRADYRQAA